MFGHTGAPRYCVITPYYKEDRALLEHCLASVRHQTIAADHILVADGFPQDWLDLQGVRHLKLDRPHGDYGNAARGIAAMAAIAEQYDGIAFLDADNWIDPDHLESCLAAATVKPDAAYIVAQRRFVRPDRSVMPTVTPGDVPYADHVDTNCYFFRPPSYHLLHHWCTLPRELAEFGDKLFFFMMQRSAASFGVVPKRTVNYLCMFEAIYTEMGETAPPGAKPRVDWAKSQAWLDSLSPQAIDLVQRLTGLGLQRTVS